MTLQQLLDRKFGGVLSGNPNPDLKSLAIEWVETSLGSTPTESTGFRNAVVQHLLAKLNGDLDKATLTAMFLRGEPHSTSELKEVGVYEKLDRANGFRLLRSLCQLLQRSELAAGTVLLFDEARRSLSLMSSKAQKVACENLLTVINRCNSGDLPGTLFLYAVMPEFFTEFATAYPALQQRCGPSTRIDLESLKIDELALLKQIGERITDVFRIAHSDVSLDDDLLRKSLQAVARLVLKETMVGSGTRRLIVGTWVRALQKFQDEGVSELSEDDVVQLLESTRQDLDASEQSAVLTEGE